LEKLKKEKEACETEKAELQRQLEEPHSKVEVETTTENERAAKAK